ncbi:hypothetical protein LCGC14_0410270 [marine sediment metagenome]|uniref:Uncharacterized protein n=1 Tax=marine sediment metagenome TaxID=412755 RepID=A0A0F9W393_9ZZZZ
MPDKGGARISDNRRRRILDRTDGYIIKHLPEYIGILEELAKGVWFEKVDGRSDTSKIYRQIPDRQALEFLIEHGIGKVPQRHELSGEEGEVTFIPWVPTLTPKPKEIEGEVVDAETYEKEETEGVASGTS